MITNANTPSLDAEMPRANRRLRLPLPSLRARLRLLQWIIPAALIALVVVYEYGPAHWVLERYGMQAHSLAEVLFFGTAGPALAFVTLELLGRWLDERDTSDWQSQIVAQVQAREEQSRSLCDDTLQVLFAAGTIIETLEAEADIPADRMEQTSATRQEVDRAIRRLRAHLLEGD